MNDPLRTRTRGRRLVLGGVCLALIVAGCATVKEEPLLPDRSGFLGKEYALLTPGEVTKGQAGLRYFNPSAQWRQYRKVIIDPVTFWGDQASKLPASDQQALATYFNGALTKAFAEKFEVVEQPGAGAMKLQVAVVDVQSATPGLRTISLVLPQARLLTAVGSMATGDQVFAGGLQVEAKMTDSATGQLLAAAIARGVGGGNVKAAAQLKWGDVENAMNLFASRSARNFQALTTGTATPDQLPVPD